MLELELLAVVSCLPDMGSGNQTQGPQEEQKALLITSQPPHTPELGDDWKEEEEGREREAMHICSQEWPCHSTEVRWSSLTALSLSSLPHPTG